MSSESCNIQRRKANRALDLFPGSVYGDPLEFKWLEKMHGQLVYVELPMVEIHAPKTVPRLDSHATIPKTGCISRQRFMFHAVYLRKKSIQQKTIKSQ